MERYYRKLIFRAVTPGRRKAVTLDIDVNDFLHQEILAVDVPPSTIPFLRDREQETKTSAALPIFAGDGSIITTTQR